MVNRLTHDDNGKRLKKSIPEPGTAQAVAHKPRQHIGARNNKLVPDAELNPRQLGINAPHLSREYEVLKALVRSDHQRIKNSPDDRDKQKKEKSRLLNQYRDYLTQWIAAGERHNNEVLFFNIVWSADVGEFDWLLKLTDYAVETGQVNDIFKSKPESIAAREVYYAADRAFKESSTVPDCFFSVFERIKKNDWQIPNSLVAKFYKLAGMDAELKHDLTLAKGYYTIADLTDKTVGVKGRLKEVTELLNSNLK